MMAPIIDIVQSFHHSQVIIKLTIETPDVETEIYGVEANLLNTVNQDLFNPDEVEDITLPSIWMWLWLELDNGDPDAVAGLFSDEGIETFDAKFDRHDISVGVDKILGTYRDQHRNLSLFFRDLPKWS